MNYNCLLIFILFILIISLQNKTSLFKNYLYNIRPIDYNNSIVNYGYYPISFENARHPEKYSLELYNILVKKTQHITNTNLDNKTVYEIPCNMGHGLNHVAEKYNNIKFYGFDFNKSLIQICNETHRVPNVKYEYVQNISNIRLDNSADIIFNIELSRTLINKKNYYKKILDTLKHGGLFVYADKFTSDLENSTLYYLNSIGFTHLSTYNITDNIITSIELDSERRRTFIPNNKMLYGLYEDTYCLDTSNQYNNMKNNNTFYKILIFRK